MSFQTVLTLVFVIGFGSALVAFATVGGTAAIVLATTTLVLQLAVFGMQALRELRQNR